MRCSVCDAEFETHESQVARGRLACSLACGHQVAGRKISRDLTGLRVNYLTVTRRMPSRVGATQKKTRWEARCDCGQTVTVDGADLMRTDGRARVSCGCMRAPAKAKSPSWRGHGEISSARWSSIRSGAKERNLDFGISIEHAWNLFLAQGRRCVFTGERLTFDKPATASLDRIDSRRGYVFGNLQWVHREVNRAKSNRTDQEFIDLCRKVVNHRG